MFPDEMLEAIAKRPVCYCAYGLAEPHGNYNALGLDWIKAQTLVERAAQMHGGVVAPPVAWHIAERPFFDFFGSCGIKQSLCSSIPEDLFFRMLLYQIRALDARGFRVGILITGHYGGLEDDMRLLADYYIRRTGSPIQLAALADWEVIRFENYHGDHAGICETSQLMALRPDLVDLKRRENSSGSGPWAGHGFPTPDGRMPSEKIGQNILDSQIKELGKLQRKLLKSYKRKKNWKAPSLTDVEGIWARFEKLTRKYWVCSRTWEQYKNKQIAPFPGWEALGE